MSLEHHYQNPTSGTTVFDTVLDAVRLGDEGFVEDGQLGAVGTGGANVDDPTGIAEYLPLQRYYALETDGPEELVLTGTVAKTAGSTTIVGTGSAFLTEIEPGDELVVPGGGGTEYLFVQTVTNNTHLEVYIAPVHSASGQTGTRAAQQRLWSGWTGDPSEDRGFDRPGGGEFIDAGRVCSFDLAEGNTALHHRILRSAGANRTHTETSGTRLAALLALAEISGRVHDDGLVHYPTTSMDKANYLGRYFDEALNDLAQVDGHNFSLDYHEAADRWQLIYQDPDTFFLPSPLRISDYAADDGAALTYHAPDAKRQRMSSSIFAGVQVTYGHGTTYRSDAAVADIYEYRDANAINSNRKKLAAAQAYGDRFLADGASPTELLTCTVVIPASKMHLCRRLRQVEVRFQHLYGWTDWRWARILRRDFHHATAENGESIPDRYEVSLVLAPAADQPVYTSSFARIDVPSDVYTASVGGASPLTWKADGDAPQAGWITAAKVGLMDYDASSLLGGHQVGSAGHAWSGIKMLGGGTVTLYCRVTGYWGMHGANTGLTIAIYKKGGATIYTTLVPDGGGSGAHIFSVNKVITVTGVSVSNGDIIEISAVLHRSEGPGIAGAAWLGLRNIWFYVTGSLA